MVTEPTNIRATQASETPRTGPIGRLARILLAALLAWLAYDLSSEPAASRGQVVVGWYNDPITTPYDHTVIDEVAYNNLGSYTIQVNPGAGGG